MRELALFAGAGGGILGGQLLGWRTVCAVEYEPYPASVLVQRQNDGLLSPFPIWDDVRTFDGKPWRGLVDVVSGGFPCQDISAAGKGAGISGERSGLWSEMARIIREVRPSFAFIENSPMLTIRGLDRVLCDLASMGFDAKWGVLGAADVGAPHKRDRIWIVGTNTDTRLPEPPKGDEHEKGQQPGQRRAARGQFASFRGKIPNADCERRGKRGEFRPVEVTGATGAYKNVADASCEGLQIAECETLQRTGRREERGTTEQCGTLLGDTYSQYGYKDWWTGLSSQPSSGNGTTGSYGNWSTEPDVGRVAHGVAARVDRLKAIGNGQVPQCAAAAWRLLAENE